MDDRECSNQNICVTPNRIKCQGENENLGFKKYVCLIDDTCPLLNAGCCKGGGCDVLASDYARKLLLECNDPNEECDNKDLTSNTERNPRKDPQEKCVIMRGKGPKQLCPFLGNGCCGWEVCSLLKCGFASRTWDEASKTWICTVGYVNGCPTGWDSGPDFWKGDTGCGANERGAFLKHANTGSLVVVFPDGNIEVYAEKCLKLFSKESIQIKSKKSIVLDACEDVCIKSGNKLNLCSKNITQVAEDQHRIKAWESVIRSNKARICAEDIQFYAKEKIRMKAWNLCMQSHEFKTYTYEMTIHADNKLDIVAGAVAFKKHEGDPKGFIGEGESRETIKTGLVKKPICPHPAGEPLPDVEQCKCCIKTYCKKGECTVICDDKELVCCKDGGDPDSCLPSSPIKKNFAKPVPPIINVIKRNCCIKIRCKPKDCYHELEHLIIDEEDLGCKYTHMMPICRKDCHIYVICRRKRVTCRMMKIKKATCFPTGDIQLKAGCGSCFKVTPDPGCCITKIIIGRVILTVDKYTPHIVIPHVRPDDEDIPPYIERPIPYKPIDVPWDPYHPHTHPIDRDRPPYIRPEPDTDPFIFPDEDEPIPKPIILDVPDIIPHHHDPYEPKPHDHIDIPVDPIDPDEFPYKPLPRPDDPPEEDEDPDHPDEPIPGCDPIDPEDVFEVERLELIDTLKPGEQIIEIRDIAKCITVTVIVEPYKPTPNDPDDPIPHIPRPIIDIPPKDIPPWIDIPPIIKPPITDPPKDDPVIPPVCKDPERI